MGRRKVSKKGPGESHAEGRLDVSARPNKSQNNRSGLVLSVVFVVVVFVVGLVVASLHGSTKEGEELKQEGTKKLPIVATLQHDGDCYTQGLFFDQGIMYESCGMYGKSKLVKYNLETGQEILSRRIDGSLFAEGIEKVGDKILMLTWREKKLLQFDAESFDLLATFSFQTQTGQGWGIASNGTTLVVTDGSEFLHFWNPDTLAEQARIPVIDPETGKPVKLLNEVEFVGSYELLANIWFQHKVARIDSRDGRVIGWYDFEGVLQKHGDNSGDPEVMNGIAIDRNKKKLYITGKRWKSMFVVDL